ncbi:MAG: hypothetical protein JL50_04110 [Peptococcaceae bacterium BICA1-7]|nr:MAG: hypothetical protein JL50_04110 [Peptococcaceae bacterium BICA1-7]HBV97552.1 hypothetical protein [Desulfotomaculum sp.]
MEYNISLQEAVDWINKNWQGDKVCPICENNDWHIGEKVAEIRQYYGENVVIGSNGAVYPLLLLTCKICGYTVLFNAIVSRLLKNKSNEESVKSK